MTDDASSLPIVHNLDAQRFEVIVQGKLCRADYRRVGDTLHMVHTEVPPPLEGRGIAAELIEAALDYVAANGLKVVPLCSYVRAYMRRHPQTHALLASGARV